VDRGSVSGPITQEGFAEVGYPTVRGAIGPLLRLRLETIVKAGSSRRGWRKSVIGEAEMVSASQENSSMAQIASDIQQHVDVVCLGAMEMQRESPDRDTVESILNTLLTVRELAVNAGAHPVIEAATVVEEAVTLALTETSAPAPYLGHFVTSTAADLSRVVHAIATGEDPTPILSHARTTLTSMPRRGTDYLVEVDLNNAVEVARIFEAMGDSGSADAGASGDNDQPMVLEPNSATQQLGRLREMRHLLASYVSQTETLRANPSRVESLNDLLVGAKALRASAAVAGIRPVERLAARLSNMFQTLRATTEPPPPDVIEFFVSCGHGIAAIIDNPEQTADGLKRIEELIDRATVILKRFNVQTAQLQTGPLNLAQPSQPATNGKAPSRTQTGARPLTIYEALQVLERDHGGHDAPSRPGPGRSRGDPDRFLADITDVSQRLPVIIKGLERDRSSVSSRAGLWDILLKLKESAALAGASVIVDQCWRVESTLTGLGEEPLTDDVLANLRGLDADLHWLLSQVRPEPKVEKTLDATDKLVVDIDSFDRLIKHVNELLIRTGGHHHRSRRLGQTVQDITVVGDRLGALSERLQDSANVEIVRRELSEIISDLAISVSDLDHLRIEEDAANARIGQVVGSLSESARNLQLTPIAALGPNLQRAVRGLTHRLGKDATFVLEGGGMMVNSTMHERLNTALLHLIRNAVDHGIEPAATRRTIGKPERGTVKLQAHRDGTQIVIEVSDDGNGIDDRLVLRRASESGYPVPPSGMTRERALQLIFLPGLTTRVGGDGRVTGGHGLDIVSQLVAEMKGTVSIDSELRRGTTVTIRLPLAVPTTSAVVVSLAGDQFVLPFVKTQVVPASVVRSIEQEGTTFLANLGAVRVPIVDLGSLLAMRAPHHVRDSGGTVLRVEQLGSHWLIKVDEVVGVQEVELQPLANPGLQPTGVVGMALLASGAQASVIDLDQLLDARRTARRRKGRNTATLKRVPFSLVADKSVTVRRSLTQVLEQAGWRAVEARDGLEAWELLESISPELLVIDLDLPLLDPFQVIRVAKSHGDIPVIAIASSNDPKLHTVAITSGVNALLQKPVNPDDLLVSLKALGGKFDEES
jgi:chemotaxis protein histidine kinase CheA/CheY-like chemotaxis protein